MDYYKLHAARYSSADEQTKKASREHWQRVHAANLASGREDLIIFSAQILAGIALADAGGMEK